MDSRDSSFKTIPIMDSKKISSGYTLITPYNRMLVDKPGLFGKIYLLDMWGNSVHTWSSNHQALYSTLMPNSNLLVMSELPKYSAFYPPGGNTGNLQELDWNSKVVWEYKNERMHHDTVPLKNGNILVALWEKTPEAVAINIKGGVAGTELKGTIWSDEIAEIDRNGKVVWSWHSYDHLDPAKDEIAPSLPRYAWTVTNGMTYVEKNPIDNTPAVVLSMRSLSTIYIIRKSDGEIIWRSPKGMLSLQHDPTVLSNGNILVFDNGYDRIPAPFATFGSRAVEIDPKTNKIVWKFEGGEGIIDKVRFFAPIVGGAQRLPNGNTLITDGPKGHIFEVTNDGKVVWDLISPYNAFQTGAFPNNFLFKTRRYFANEINFPKGLTPAFDQTKYYLFKLLRNIYPE